MHRLWFLASSERVDGSNSFSINMVGEVKLAQTGDKATRIIVQYDMILWKILQIFTFSTGHKALEIAMFLLRHENDKTKAHVAENGTVILARFSNTYNCTKI